MAVYMQLPRNRLPMDSGESFWIGGPPQLAAALKEFGEYFDLKFLITATLIRKALTTSVGELVTERAQNLVSRVQYHSQRTSGKYYNVRPARRDSLVAKEIVNLVMDGEVQYPEEDFIERKRASEVVQDWQFAHPRAPRAASKPQRQADKGRLPKEIELFWAPEVGYNGEDSTHVEICKPVLIAPGEEVGPILAPEEQWAEPPMARIEFNTKPADRAQLDDGSIGGFSASADSSAQRDNDDLDMPADEASLQGHELLISFPNSSFSCPISLVFSFLSCCKFPCFVFLF